MLTPAQKEGIELSLCTSETLTRVEINVAHATCVSFSLPKFYLCKYFYHIMRHRCNFFLTTRVHFSVFILQYIAHMLLHLHPFSSTFHTDKRGKLGSLRRVEFLWVLSGCSFLPSPFSTDVLDMPPSLMRTLIGIADTTSVACYVLSCAVFSTTDPGGHHMLSSL